MRKGNWKYALLTVCLAMCLCFFSSCTGGNGSDASGTSAVTTAGGQESSSAESRVSNNLPIIWE